MEQPLLALLNRIARKDHADSLQCDLVAVRENAVFLGGGRKFSVIYAKQINMLDSSRAEQRSRADDHLIHRRRQMADVTFPDHNRKQPGIQIGIDLHVTANGYQFIQRRLVPEGWYDWVSNCEFLPSSTYVAFNAMAAGKVMLYSSMQEAQLQADFEQMTAFGERLAQPLESEEDE